jgi:hypothetical protein
VVCFWMGLSRKKDFSRAFRSREIECDAGIKKSIRPHYTSGKTTVVRATVQQKHSSESISQSHPRFPHHPPPVKTHTKTMPNNLSPTISQPTTPAQPLPTHIIKSKSAFHPNPPKPQRPTQPKPRHSTNPTTLLSGNSPTTPPAHSLRPELIALHFLINV